MAAVYVLGNQAQSTCASPITNAQTTVTLASTTAFTVPGTTPAGTQQYLVRIDDTANTAWTQAAGPYEFAMVTANNTGTATLTITRGQEGTSGTAFLAGATVTQVLTTGTLKGVTKIKLAEVVLGAAQATVSFTSIPSVYRHLDLEYTARGDAAVTGQDVAIQFNGDTTASYNWVQVFGNNAAATSNAVTPASNIGVGRIPGASGATNQPGSATVHIPNYSGTTYYKNAISNSISIELSGVANFWIITRGGAWSNVAAINQVTALLTSAGNFASGSVFTLYGIP